VFFISGLPGEVSPRQQPVSASEQGAVGEALRHRRTGKGRKDVRLIRRGLGE